jgi:hypothetical protein
MTETTIKETRSGAQGRYVLAAADGDSELTYRLNGDRMIILLAQPFGAQPLAHRAPDF